MVLENSSWTLKKVITIDGKLWIVKIQTSVMADQVNSSSHSSQDSPYSSTNNQSMITPFGNSLNQIMSIKLNDSNFLLWKSIIVPPIEGCRLDGILFGTIKVSPLLTEQGEPYLEYQVWHSRDRMLYA
ncbi:hypothetical protein Syun_001365 [Stephania yunnanensis]|uniref:Retrotransposon Copia-like N-terminal domain-containing protein n=1 Tax=Stephania yunnanensis TaxID=152371 RepID=A0AAP0Q6E3_9MAGN